MDAYAATTDPYADGYNPPVAPAAEPARSPLPARRTRSPSPARANGNGNGYRASSPPRGGRSPRRPAHAPAAPPPSNVLGVFGLSIRTQERDLDDEFSRFGRVEKVTIVYDQRSGRSRGFGFIRMGSIEDATKCVQELNGVELSGRRIRVDFSVTDRAHHPTPGEYMGHRRRGDGDSYRGGGSSGGAGGGGRDSYRDSYRRDDRDRDYGRDRDHGRDSGRSERDRDPYGRDNRDSRDWRDRRSPPPARGGGGRYSPDHRRRRSYSRSPVRGSAPGGGDRDRDRRDYDGDRYSSRR